MVSNYLYKKQLEKSAELSLEKVRDETTDKELLALPKEECFKLKERVFREFKGAGTCDGPDIYNSIAMEALEEWVKKKMFEFRHLRYIRYGHLGGIVRWSTYSGRDGSTCYKGLVVVKCYIEWKKEESTASDRATSAERDYPYLRKA